MLENIRVIKSNIFDAKIEEIGVDINLLNVMYKEEIEK